MVALASVTRDQVIARLRQSERPKFIAAELGVNLTTVYRIGREEQVGAIDHRMGNHRRNTLSAPAVPSAHLERVTIDLTDDELAGLAAPRKEAIIVASMLQSDSLRSRVLSAVGHEGPFQNVEELANTIRRKTDNFGYHELTTIVKHLRKQGLVSLKENKRRTPGATESQAIDIDLTVQGRAKLGITAQPLGDRILELLCRDSLSRSSMRLAADLYRGAGDDADTPRVEAALQLLNSNGSVVYKLGPAGTLVDIKPTDRGYEKAGWPVAGRQREGAFGQKRAGTSRPGHAVGVDRTEKRHHLPWATGGPIIREPLDPDHRALFPAHVHGGDEPTATVALETPTVVSVPEPNPELPTGAAGADYPLLTKLRASFAERAAADLKASRLADAAALLEQVDPEESERLMARALEASPVGLTALEAEFLHYAAEHSNG